MSPREFISNDQPCIVDITDSVIMSSSEIISNDQPFIVDIPDSDSPKSMSSSEDQTCIVDITDSDSPKSINRKYGWAETKISLCCNSLFGVLILLLISLFIWAARRA